MHTIQPTTYNHATLEIRPTVAARYLPTYPYRIVHWYRTRMGWHAPQGGCETLGHYRTRAEAERALTRLSRSSE